LLAVAASLAGLFYLIRPSAVDSSGEDILPRAPTGDIHAVTGAAPTVAIRPFEVAGQIPEQAYLAHGLGAELTASLSRLSGLTVVGPSPIGTGAVDESPPLAAARYRLWGEAVHDQGRIQLRLVLIAAATAEQVWSRRLDRPFANLTSLAEDAALALAEALAVEVTAAERRQLTRRRTNSAAAFDLFLRAQSNLLKREASHNLEARELYRRALALDPNFARALGGVALTHAADYRNRWTPDPEVSLASAREAAQAAARLDPGLPEVLWVQAYVHVREGDHESALQLLDRALELDPSFADAYALKGGVLTYVGAPTAALPLLKRAIRLNPRAGYLYWLTLGRAQFYLGDSAQAVRSLRTAASRNPANLELRIYLAAALAASGKGDAAQWEALEIANLAPGFSLSQWLETHPLRDKGHRERLIATLREVGLTQQTK
jgi:TolB-like protein/Flp pilus assembly protein TadD